MSLMYNTFNIIPELIYEPHYEEINANIEENQKNKILEHFRSKRMIYWESTALEVERP